MKLEVLKRCMVSGHRCNSLDSFAIYEETEYSRRMDELSIDGQTEEEGICSPTESELNLQGIFK